MPLISTGEINLFYQRQGAGEPLLMVYGLGGNSAYWFPELIQALSREFEVITFDNRGVGRSDKPDIEYSIAMLADDSAGLLRALGVARAHIFGISMGGMIVQELALRHPDLVHTLIPGCTTAGGRHSLPPTPEAVEALQPPRDDETPADFIRRCWPFMYASGFLASHRDKLEAELPRLIEYPTPPYAYRRQLKGTFTLKVYDRLDQIRAPTLAITGVEDRILPAGNSEIIAARIPGARAHLMADAGHLFFNERMEEFLSVFVPFLKAHPMTR